MGSIAKDAGYMVGRYVECGSSGSMQGRVKVMVVGIKNSSEKWKIGDEEMEEVARVLQIPGALFDQKMRGMCSWRR